MTSPEPSATRPLRVAGLALLGVAAVALVIGLVSMFGGNGDDQANGGDNEQPSATSSADPTGGSVPPPSSGSGSTSVSANPTTTTTSTTTPPGTNVPVPPGGDGNGESDKTEPVRVYNNSTVGGLGSRAADELRESGWNVTEVGNYPSGVIPTTTVYFRPGTPEETQAELLGDEFGMRVEPRFPGIAELEPGLIVIVTNDYQGPGGDREPTEKNDK